MEITPLTSRLVMPRLSRFPFFVESSQISFEQIWDLTISVSNASSSLLCVTGWIEVV